MSNDRDLETAADIAIDTDSAVLYGHWRLIPDIFEMEGVANGLPELPPTLQLVRVDGRSVKVFWDPEDDLREAVRGAHVAIFHHPDEAA